MHRSDPCDSACPSASLSQRWRLDMALAGSILDTRPFCMADLIILTAAHQCCFGQVLQLLTSASHVWHVDLQEETTILGPCNVHKTL